MATAVDRRQLDDDIAPAESGVVSPVQKRRGWIKRMMHSSYSPVAAAVAEKGRATSAAAEDDGATTRTTTKPRRRGGWLRRLMASPREHDAPLGRRRHRKLGGGVGGGSASRLLAGLPSWKRVSIGGGWASALLDAAAFRVMYVVEAVVLGLALSCFFCCCGCQI